MQASVAAVAAWSERVFAAAGLGPEAAAATAANLAFAELRGVRSHGFIRVPIYLERIAAGGIAGSAATRITEDLGALVLMDGNGAIGAVNGVDATDAAIERAERYGIGFAIVRNSNHFGAAGYYTERIARAGLLGIAICNTDKAMCAPFGGKRVLGTNPLSIGVPIGAELGPQLDMATSEVSLGKLLVAAQNGSPIPSHWAVDVQGRPTQSAELGIEGALLPAGGAKGFGLAFMIDALLAVGGAELSPEVGPLYGDPAQPQRLGIGIMAIRVATDGIGQGDYAEKIRDLIARVHESGPGPGGQPALYPGEPEQSFERAQQGLMELSDGLLESLRAEERRYSVPLAL